MQRYIEELTDKEIMDLYTVVMRSLKNVRSRKELINTFKLMSIFWLDSGFARLTNTQQKELTRFCTDLQQRYGNVDLSQLIENV